MIDRKDWNEQREDMEQSRRSVRPSRKWRNAKANGAYKELNRIVSAYLDLAENRAERGIVTQMAEWAEFLNQFLELSNYPILQ
jgi:hypothetical protein